MQTALKTRLEQTEFIEMKLDIGDYSEWICWVVVVELRKADLFHD